MSPQQTRRAGFSERRLLGPALSKHQNVVLIDAEEGAEVELHRVPNSESFFVIQGELQVSGPDFEESLRPGDFCHFRPGMSHAVSVVAGPAQFLIIFAPAGTPRAASGAVGSADE
jgi:quercetin dioxygenase-like cupin family protein